MHRTAIVWIALQSVTMSLCGHAAAQLTITEPEPADEAVRQVSLSTDHGIVAARQGASSGKQIRVRIQYLMVDRATRSAIYENLDAEAIRTTTQIPQPAESVRFDETQATVGASQQISAPSRVTCCVLSDADTVSVVKQASESATSDVAVAPSVILLDGAEAEMNDVVQRPFVIDMRAEGDTVKPAMHVLDDGTRMRLLANLADASGAEGQPIQLTCEIVTSRVLDVKTDQVFGVQDEPVSVQVPIHQVITAIATGELGKNQSLLVDPHVSKKKQVESHSAVPVLGKIPYVGRSFRNVEVGALEQHMMVLLQPSLEKASR